MGLRNGSLRKKIDSLDGCSELRQSQQNTGKNLELPLLGYKRRQTPFKMGK